MSSLNNRQFAWYQSHGYSIDEDGEAMRNPEILPALQASSRYAHVFLNSLSSSVTPKPVPIYDMGERYVGNESRKHFCLHRAPFQTISSLSPFVVPTGPGYASIFPGCTHGTVYQHFMDVIIHIFQEHLENIDKDYYCIDCNNQYTQKQDAKRHHRTNTPGAILHACNSPGCSYTTTRSDSLRAHERNMH